MEQENEHGVIRFAVDDEAIALRICGTPQRLVYLHEIQDDGEAVWQQCLALECHDFALATIQIPTSKWNDALTPWECAGLFADDVPFAGQASNQLELLVDEIIPQAERAMAPVLRSAAASAQNAAENSLPKPVRILAGYSLAGLFATWATFQCAAFSRIASASGSLWYPGFDEFAAEHDFVQKPECAYFSLGSKEARTPSRLLRHVAEGTAKVVSAFQEKGVETTFEKNPGNHFKEPDLRMAKGIAWALEH